MDPHFGMFAPGHHTVARKNDSSTNLSLHRKDGTPELLSDLCAHVSSTNPKTHASGAIEGPQITVTLSSRRGGSLTPAELAKVSRYLGPIVRGAMATFEYRSSDDDDSTMPGSSGSARHLHQSDAQESKYSPRGEIEPHMGSIGSDVLPLTPHLADQGRAAGDTLVSAPSQRHNGDQTALLNGTQRPATYGTVGSTPLGHGKTTRTDPDDHASTTHDGQDAMSNAEAVAKLESSLYLVIDEQYESHDPPVDCLPLDKDKQPYTVLAADDNARRAEYAIAKALSATRLPADSLLGKATLSDLGMQVHTATGIRATMSSGENCPVPEFPDTEIGTAQSFRQTFDFSPNSSSDHWSLPVRRRMVSYMSAGRSWGANVTAEREKLIAAITKARDEEIKRTSLTSDGRCGQVGVVLETDVTERAPSVSACGEPPEDGANTLEHDEALRSMMESLTPAWQAAANALQARVCPVGEFGLSESNTRATAAIKKGTAPPAHVHSVPYGGLAGGHGLLM